MNLRRRLASLERSAGPRRPGACPACGRRPGEPAVYRLLPFGPPAVIGRPRPERPRHGGPETCPGCGRPLLIRLRPMTVGEPAS